MLLTGLLGAALAGTFGNPRRVDYIVAVDLAYELGATAESVPDCEGDRCVAWSRQDLAALRLSGRPHEAVNLYGDVALGQTSVRGAGFDSRMGRASAGVNLHIPRDGLTAGASFRGETARGPVIPSAGQDQLSSWRLEGGAFLVTGNDGWTFWGGPYISYGESGFFLYPEAMQLQLIPSPPAGAELGVEFLSDPLRMWKKHKGYLVGGVTMRVGRGATGALSIGFAY